MGYTFLSEVSKEEYEAFVKSHPTGNFMQSLLWPQVKSGWGHDGVVVKNKEGQIVGSILILTRRIPAFGTQFFYAPRGPVCDPEDADTLRALTEGVKELAGRHHAHVFKCDPDVKAENGAFIKSMEGLGYTHFSGGLDFETIQPRFNYRLYFKGRTEEELFQNLQQKTRYNVRLAMRKGVEVRVCGEDMLSEFVRLMEITGKRDGFQTRPQAYFEGMLKAMGKHVRLYMAFYEGSPVAGAITTNYGGKTCYVYGASDNAHRNVMPTYLLQWEMIRWALETGCTVYDFQGVSGDLSEDHHLYGLYRFKRGFHGDLVELCGEFHLVFKPFVHKAIEAAATLRDKASHHRKGRGE